MAGVVDLFARGFLVGARELDFQVLADVYCPHAGIAHVGQGALHRLALRIDDRFLWCNNDFGFQTKLTSAATTG